MNFKHGMDGTPTYRARIDMRQRCLNSRHPAYPNYGGRGITVCERWRDSFESFLADVGARPATGLPLERIDNDQSYEPGNVRWATRSEQQRNRRATRLTPAAIEEIRTSALPSTALAKAFGVHDSTIRKVRRGERWAS